MDVTKLDLIMISILSKYCCRSLNAYPMKEDIFLFKGNSTTKFNPKPTKPIRYILNKKGIFM